MSAHTPTLVERLRNGGQSDLADMAADLLAALDVAEQFMSIASDWNFDEAEINGEMRSTYEWLNVVRAAIAKATGGAA